MQVAMHVSATQMKEANCLFPASIFLLSFFILLNFILKRNPNYKNLPPSPPAIPIIGHLHLLKEPLHRSLHNFTKKHGPIMFLRFGSRKVLVVSSASAIEECFTKNDIVFANRPRIIAGKHLGYDYKGLGFASYGDHWRRLRRLTSLELLSSNRLATFTGIREDEVRQLAKQIFLETQNKKIYQNSMSLRPKLTEVAFNTILRMVSGEKYYGDNDDAKEAKKFQSLMKEVVEIMGANLHDFFPILQLIDFNGVEKRMVNSMNKMNNFLQKLLDKHQKNHEGKMTLIDVMLSLQQSDPEFYTDENIKGLIAAMLVAGSETSATTMEWALSLLLNDPKAMQKVKIEIDQNVGHQRLLDESDLPKLPFLQNVITETLRLYPPTPFLIPHESSNDCIVSGFDVPKGTMLLANLWTMQRDPELWDNPMSFLPERFEGKNGIEGYNMLPFGAGRRACLGAGLAKRVMGYVLGVLLHAFEWEKIDDEEVSMVEGIGLTLPKLEPLVAHCKPCNAMLEVLSNL